VKEAAHSCAVEEGAGVDSTHPCRWWVGGQGDIIPPARPGRGGCVPLALPTPTSPTNI